LGLIASLYYAWLVEPVTYIAAAPNRLSDAYKDEYILLVSESFAADSNWVRARARLEELHDADLANTVNSQLEQYIRDGKSAKVLSNLAMVAYNLGSQSRAVALFVSDDQQEAAPTAVGVIATRTLKPTPTTASISSPTAAPSATTPPEPAPTSQPQFNLLKQERICLRNKPLPVIEVVVYDALLEPVRGVEIVVRWETGSDNFFTGYQPDLGAGFADFVMEPETSYSVELAAGSTLVEGLMVEECGGELGGLAGGWRLTYQITDDST
jgi:hypothetical protein